MAGFAVVEVVVVGMKTVRALQGFFFPVGLKWSEAFLAPRRLRHVLGATVFANQIRAHSILMLKTGLGFFILMQVGSCDIAHAVFLKIENPEAEV